MMPASFRILTLLAALGALFGLVLAALRISHTLDFSEPLQLVTSGAEWESMFAVWKVINGQTLYTDRLMIPFNAVVYNWLFYVAYGAFSGGMLELFGLGDAWLPTVGRHFTLVGVAAGMVAGYALLENLFDKKSGWTRLLAFSFAAYIMAGPLVGWWSFTMRADTWALALEVIAVALFVLNYPARRMKAILLLAAFCFAAWSFKQTYVTVAGAAGLFLLLRRDWKGIAIFTAIMVTLWGAALFFGGAQYRANILFADFTLVFTLEQGIFNLTSLAGKTEPGLLGVAAIAAAFILSPTARQALKRDDALTLGACGLVLSSAMAIPSSFHTGGADNYFFSMSLFMALVTVAGIAVLLRERDAAAGPVFYGTAAGWAVLVVAIGMVFAGRVGVTDVRWQHANNTARKQCLDSLPRPLFADYSFYALPWITPGNEPFVASFQYLVESRAGKKFERGGIGGLISEGHFEALAFILAPPPTYDGASLDGYTLRTDLCQAMSVMLKNPD